MTRRSPLHERPQKNEIILGGTRSDGSFRWDEWVCGQCMKTNWLCSTACREKGCQGRPSPAQVVAGAGVRSNVSPSKRGEEAAAGTKHGTTFTSLSSTVAGSSGSSISSSAAQEVKTRISKLEALLKCARDAQDEDVIRATDSNSLQPTPRGCALNLWACSWTRRWRPWRRPNSEWPRPTMRWQRLPRTSRRPRRPWPRQKPRLPRFARQPELDTLPPTQVTDPAEPMKDLPKAGQDAIQQLAEGLWRAQCGEGERCEGRRDAEAGDGHRGGTCGVQASVRRRQQQRGQRLGAARDAHDMLPPMIEYDALVFPHRDFDSTQGYPGEGPPEVGCECCPPGPAGRVQAKRPWAMDVCGFCARPAQRNKWGYRCLECSTFWCR